jgi:hypothetical protein
MLTCSKYAWRIVDEDEPIISVVIFEPATAISNQPVEYACNPVVVFLTNRLMLVRFCPACGVIVTVATL